MALNPSNNTGKDILQPGARGDVFKASLPGYRDGADRINRTNARLSTSQHDVLNCKYMLDRRLTTLFKYGFAYGYNQIVVPKGRIMAVDPHMDMVDFDTQKEHNVLTLANGGVPVRVRKDTDVYKDSGGSTTALVDVAGQGKAVHGVGKEWIPLEGMAAAYTDKCYRALKVATAAKQLADASMSIDAKTGKVKDASGVLETVRPANIPVGMIGRNEYTRDEDAYNGIMPGPIMTDALVELPWFAFKDKAEQNFWGCAYGGLFPGALVKSDENGRLTISPLSFESEMANMTLPEYEAERQQVVGQVYAVSNNLLPEGAAIWATWALEERANFEDFNPTMFAQNNRRGEDAVARTPYKSSGEYPGYPYENALHNNDLHMLGAARNAYDPRMNVEYQLDNLGIPGLTDGYNAVVRDIGPQKGGMVRFAGGADYIDMYMRLIDVAVEKGSIEIAFDSGAFVPCTEGAEFTLGTDKFLKAKYVDEHQGMIVLEVTDKAKADAYLGAAAGKAVQVSFRYKKRGLAGVPTFMDWDGCIGSTQILLTK